MPPYSAGTAFPSASSERGDVPAADTHSFAMTPEAARDSEIPWRIPTVMKTTLGLVSLLLVVFRGQRLRFASQCQGRWRSDRGSQWGKRFLASAFGRRDHSRYECVRRTKKAGRALREGVLSSTVLLGLSRESAGDGARRSGLLHRQEREGRADLDRRTSMTRSG
jgi:hypothetical protein